MKKLILIIAVLFCIGVKAQTVDTVQHAIQVKPYVINSIKKDTVFQTKVERVWGGLYDTTITSYVILYDRCGRNVGEENVILPYSFLYAWRTRQEAENYILTFLGLQRKQ